VVRGCLLLASPAGDSLGGHRPGRILRRHRRIAHKKGEFLRESLPGAVRFFEKRMAWSGEDGAAVERATGWRPSDESCKVYVGRDAEKRLIGSAVFLWMPSQHGPVGIGVAFDPEGTIRRATVTDVAAEPLVWVRPLLEGQALRDSGSFRQEPLRNPHASRLRAPGP
jgi:hypothetical protein